MASTWYAYVYFARFCCRIKIGISDKPLRRVFDDLHCDELLGVEIGGGDREAALHRQFAHCRVRGEWFEATPDLIAYIASLPSDPVAAQLRFLKDEAERLRRHHTSLTEQREQTKFGIDETRRRITEVEKMIEAAKADAETGINVVRVGVDLVADDERPFNAEYKRAAERLQTSVAEP